MANELEFSVDNVQFFADTLFDAPHRNEADVVECVDRLRVEVVEQCGGMFVATAAGVQDKRQLLNIVAPEVVPMIKVTTFLLNARFGSQQSSREVASKPVFVTTVDVSELGLVRLDSLWSPQGSDVRPLIVWWVQRFRGAYEEISDPQAILTQWLTSANMDKVATAIKLNYPLVLARDLNTTHTPMSVDASGSNRTRYLRSLPRAYVKFYAELAKRKCQSCNQFPAR
jgi:hypothetical protein